MRLLGRDAAATRRLANVFLFGAARLVSVGPQCSGINTLPVGSETVAQAVGRALFVDQAASMMGEFMRATTVAPTQEWAS